MAVYLWSPGVSNCGGDWAGTVDTHAQPSINDIIDRGTTNARKLPRFEAKKTGKEIRVGCHKARKRGKIPQKCLAAQGMTKSRALFRDAWSSTSRSKLGSTGPKR